jgi:hypothetical protein
MSAFSAKRTSRPPAERPAGTASEVVLELGSTLACSPRSGGPSPPAWRARRSRTLQRAGKAIIVGAEHSGARLGKLLPTYGVAPGLGPSNIEPCPAGSIERLVSSPDRAILRFVRNGCGTH